MKSEYWNSVFIKCILGIVCEVSFKKVKILKALANAATEIVKGDIKSIIKIILSPKRILLIINGAWIFEREF